MVLSCPYHHDCVIDCIGSDACTSLSVDARYSSKLLISDCYTYIPNSLHYNTAKCQDITMFIPPNTNGQKNCYLAGDNALNALKIYAVNGWNDIDMTYTGTFYAPTGSLGTMYCTSDYSEPCEIHS
eukprot:117728_1